MFIFSDKKTSPIKSHQKLSEKNQWQSTKVQQLTKFEQNLNPVLTLSIYKNKEENPLNGGNIQ